MQRVSIQTQSFEESSKELKNPGCGFYHVYAFMITDEDTDYAEKVREYVKWDPNTTLALVEINLQNYRTGDISQAGVENINALLAAWSESGKRLIVRFLYDWNGENLLHEPENLDIIIRHISQTGPLLLRYADTIFTLQGLFVGNWGELHHTKFNSDDDLRRLARTLARVTGDNMYLSVRTPAQWRAITQQGTDRLLTPRLGLFNDGLLGSGTDLGTYDMARQGDERRSRDDELAFQEKLCASVPNGGEVVSDNLYNDFENAAADLATMHVTYLNRDYDEAVLKKWAGVTVSGRGCFDGLDGLSYIQRHLGYRLLMTEAAAARKLFQQQINLKVSFHNEGFAPLYTSPEITVVLQKEEVGTLLSFPAEHNLLELDGGRNTQKIGTVQASIPFEDLTPGVYRIYLDLQDPASKMPILLANKQEREENGYFVGTFTLQ